MSRKNSLPKSPKKSNDKDEQINSSALLPGWPGYRTREGRTGYDPIDTPAEAAHTAGSIIQKLFMGRVRNPIYLFLLGAAGLVLATPLVLAILETANGNQFPWNAWLFLLITGIVGFAFLINFSRNLIKNIFR